MNDKDLLLIKHFRTNGRQSLTKISKKTNIPISTIYDKLKIYEKDLIYKHTALINFKKLGFEIRLKLFVTATNREGLRSYLQIHDRVNTLNRVNNGFDFEVEALFRNMNEFQQFMDDIGQFDIKNKQEYFILDDLLKERFMTLNPFP